jgi:hypothetical protein
MRVNGGKQGELESDGGCSLEAPHAGDPMHEEHHVMLLQHMEFEQRSTSTQACVHTWGDCRRRGMHEEDHRSREEGDPPPEAPLALQVQPLTTPRPKRRQPARHRPSPPGGSHTVKDR